VLRGGAWNNNQNNVRAANRINNDPDNMNNNVGVRCAASHDCPRWAGNSTGLRTRGRGPSKESQRDLFLAAPFGARQI